MIRLVLVVVALLAMTACNSSPGKTPSALEPPEPFGQAEIVLRGPDRQAVEVPVSVADNPGERSRGLMFREELPARTGMVFLYSEPHRGSFYMKNTLIPLSIAFYGTDGVVLRVLDMQPCQADPCELYDPGVPYLGALEVNQGFFNEIGLVPGWRVELPEDLPTPTA